MSRQRAPRAPGPRGHLLLGSLPEFRHDTIGLLQRSADTYGDVIRFRIGPMTVHLVNHPEHVEHVLVRRARNYDKQTRSVAKIRTTCGRSLLSADGAVWERHRRLIQPAFRQSHLQQYAPLIRDQVDVSLHPWRDVARSGGEIEIVSAMMHLTLRVAARILFGADLAPDADVIERALRIIMHDTWRRIEGAIDMAAVSPVFQRLQVRRAIRDIDRVVYRIIADRRRRRQAAPADDLLSMLLAAHEAEGEQRLSDAELRDAAVTLLLAGHETTANALAWAVLLVAQHPDIEQRLAEEVQRSGMQAPPAGGHGYARLVFEETIRLYPSVWILERRSIQADVIGGFRIPAGSTVMLSPYLLHRHPEFWDCPNAFRPERFAVDVAPVPDRHAYIPFGLGPHRCIGQMMSLLVADLVLEHLYREFQLRLVPGQTFQARPGITLQHAGGIRMRVQERTPMPRAGTGEPGTAANHSSVPNSARY